MGKLKKVSGANLHHENQCYIYPLCGVGAPTTHFETIDGWEPKGWAYAPWEGRHKTAIVFEKTCPADEDSYDAHENFEPGIYWCHGPKDMDIRASSD